MDVGKVVGDVVGMEVAQTPKPSVQLAHVGDIVALRELAAGVEKAGFARVWLAETRGPDALLAAAVIAERTGLEVGTSILPAMSRTPAVTAMAAADLARLSGRPVHLGIGAGGQAIVERWHGQPFGHAVRRVEDTLAIVRQALSGGRTDHQGLRSSQGFALSDPPASPVLLYVGGMGPRMLELAGRVADGLILTWVSPRVAAERRERLEAVAAASGREPGTVRLVTRAYVSVVDDPGQAAKVRDLVAHEMTEYVASPPYAAYFRAIGYGEEADAVQAGFAAGDRRASRLGVSDRMVDDFLIVGSAADCRKRIDEFFEAGADDVIVQVVGPERGGDVVATVEALGARYAD